MAREDSSPAQGRQALEWAGRNGLKRRRRADRSIQAGEVVAAMTDVVQRSWLNPALAAASALAPLVDESFCRHCRVACAAAGRVVIQVDEPALVAVMRQRWLGVVRGGLASLDRRLSTGTVVFEAGRSGVVVSLV